MSSRNISAASTLLWLGCTATSLRADGGALLLSQQIGSYRISLFGSPAPVRVGDEDFSVLLQDSQTENPLLQARMKLVLTSPGGNHLQAEPTQSHATNKILYAATVYLPDPGKWYVQIKGTHGTQSFVTAGSFQVLHGPPALITYWLYFALIPFLIAVFALHQWLEWQRQNKRQRTL